MLFNSAEFIFFFLPIVISLYWAMRLRSRGNAAKLVLVGSSLVFYGWWDPRYVPVMILTVCVNYAVSILIERDDKRRMIWFAGAIAANLGLLSFFKYYDFAATNLNNHFGWSITLHHFALPLAISFFTFQQIAYIVEVYKDRKAADSFIDYSLFVMFFPHLIAGPITHHKEMLPQFKKAGHGALPPAVAAAGLAVFVIGLAKKVVVADTLATFADPAFAAAGAGRALSAASAWTGSLAYAFQIYFDFSGYSDMAIGLALLFGIRLPVNFASPYKATSIIDFWRRWHISLSRFLRAYLYIPLGGNRHGTVRQYANLFATMAIGGLWHGAGWTFIAWGALHGLYLVVNHGWRRVFGEAHGRAATLLGRAATFAAVVVAWVPFRAPTGDAATAMLAAMAGFGGASASPSGPALASIAAAAAMAFLAPNSLELAAYRQRLAPAAAEAAPLAPCRLRIPRPVAAAALGAAAALALAMLPDPGVFLYFNF